MAGAMIAQPEGFLGAHLLMEGAHWLVRIGIDFNWAVVDL